MGKPTYAEQLVKEQKAEKVRQTNKKIKSFFQPLDLPPWLASLQLPLQDSVNRFYENEGNAPNSATAPGDGEPDEQISEARAFRDITHADLPPWLASLQLPLQDSVDRFYENEGNAPNSATAPTTVHGQKRRRDNDDAEPLRERQPAQAARMEDANAPNSATAPTTAHGQKRRRDNDNDEPLRERQPARTARTEDADDDDEDEEEVEGSATSVNDDGERQPAQTATVEGDEEEGGDDAEEDVVVDIADVQEKNNRLIAHGEDLMDSIVEEDLMDSIVDDDLAADEDDDGGYHRAEDLADDQNIPAANDTSPPLTSDELFELLSTPELQAFLTKLHSPQLARGQRTPKSSPVSLYKDPESPRKFSSDVECFLFKEMQEALRMAQPELSAADMCHFHGSLKSNTIAMMHYPTNTTATNGKHQSIADLSNPCIRWLAEKFDLADMFLFDYFPIRVNRQSSHDHHFQKIWAQSEATTGIVFRRHNAKRYKASIQNKTRIQLSETKMYGDYVHAYLEFDGNNQATRLTFLLYHPESQLIRSVQHIVRRLSQELYAIAFSVLYPGRPVRWLKTAGRAPPRPPRPNFQVHIFREIAVYRADNTDDPGVMRSIMLRQKAVRIHRSFQRVGATKAAAQKNPLFEEWLQPGASGAALEAIKLLKKMARPQDMAKI
ncbi:hypothetical protein LTR22_026859 [Elasticomyces elasticus]|nr:hypothetical protein LTR22_026859 [Elasticomyces elasticus]